MQEGAVKGPVMRASAKTLQMTVDHLGEELVYEVQSALKAVNEMPGGLQEAAVKGLCEKLEEARALVFSWANDHGEP